jgi:hypothetical protein
MNKRKLGAGWLAVLLVVGGCGETSPEDGRARGGGAGADGGNYEAKPIPVPSKIDATKDLGILSE